MKMRDLMKLCETLENIAFANENPSPFGKGYESLWIDDTGHAHNIPAWGHHEDIAFSIFANGMEDYETDYKGIAIDHGWIRVILRGAEMNLEFSKACSSKAIRLVMKFLQQAQNVQTINIEYWAGKAEGGHAAEHQLTTEPNKLGGVLRSFLK